MFTIGLKDVVDIVLVAVILHQLYKLMKQSRSLNIFYGVLVFVIFWIAVSKVLEMKLTGGMLDQLAGAGAVALIVPFQEEIRQFFSRLGQGQGRHRLLRLLSKERRTGESGEFRHSHDDIIPIVLACINMSKQHVGALIVMQNDLPLGDFIRTGETVDARISQRLIENIFFKNSPLHDGAMIIGGNKITAAACILPISHDLDIPKDFGLRHRAAKGISHETDAMAVVVSEETGNITVAWDNQFQSHITAEELETLLMKGRF